MTDKPLMKDKGHIQCKGCISAIRSISKLIKPELNAIICLKCNRVWHL